MKNLIGGMMVKRIIEEYQKSQIMEKKITAEEEAEKLAKENEGKAE